MNEVTQRIIARIGGGLFIAIIGAALSIVLNLSTTVTLEAACVGFVAGVIAVAMR